MKGIIPKFKKSIKDYAKNEQGRMTKQALLSMGAFIGSAALAGILASERSVAHTNDHQNNISLQVINDRALGQHTHHASY